MWLRAAFACMVIGVAVAPGCGYDRSTDDTPDPAGYYEGTVHSETLGELSISANLSDEGDSLTGTLFTPVGNFPLSEDSDTADAMAFRFVAPDGEVGTVVLRSDGDELVGRFSLSADSGSISLRRVGAVRDVSVGPAVEDLALSTEQWREDLDHLASQLPQVHGDAFHTVTRERFEGAVRELEGALPTLEGHEVVAGMQEIVALIGDGHTYLRVPKEFRRYPIRLYWFEDGLRITEVVTGCEDLLGGRVLRIGGVDVHDAEQRIRRYIARKENEFYLLTNTAYFLTIAELLHASGIVSGLDSADWTVETVTGELVTISLAPASPEIAPTWVVTAQSEPLFRQRPSEVLWYVFLSRSQTLYVSFRGYPPTPEFSDFVDELFGVAEQQDAERLVIDLRQNSGGDFNKVRDILLPRLREHPFNREGRLYVAIGRHTFSAAMTNAADFLNETSAILVGEPTGARPNGWQENRQFTLPNSGLTVSYSTQFYEFLDEDVPAVRPHVRIDPTWESFRAGTDPVLEWIEEQPIPE